MMNLAWPTLWQVQIWFLMHLYGKNHDMFIFMPPKELLEAYSNRTVRPSVSPSVPPSRFRVRSISPIFFEVGIPNLVCGYILRWRSVAYYFRVTVTLASDLVFRIIVSRAYLILFEVGISNLVCGCILGWRSVMYHNWVTVTLNLTSDLVFRNCIESGAYLLYSLRKEFQIWCLNASWDDGVSHAIFGSLWPWPLT